MCGIGAIFDSDPGRVDRVLAAFTRLQAHRGPDDADTLKLATTTGLTLGFAHTRLAIIDLSPGGRQPMSDGHGNVVVFNGEIYNYRELAADLEARGARFRSGSDTEVLLEGYRHFGVEALLDRLRGMFAFALWDAGKQSLLIARDPNGIKPLYYTAARGRFACASEAKALKAAGLADGGLDPAALDSFLAYGSVQAPLSIHRDVRALLPGHFMWVRGDGRAGDPVRYWDWGRGTAAGGSGEIAARLEESLRRHLVADVPVAVFLSGGFDSAALTTLASRVSPEPVKSFTVSFPDAPGHSEGPAAAAIAARLGTEHSDIALREADMIEALPDFIAALDQPSDDGFNVYLISRAVAGAGIKACLHGVGGDELFGGYPSFRLLPRIRRLASVPEAGRRLLAALVDGDGIARSKLAELLRGDLGLLDAFLVRRRLFSYEQRRSLLGGEPPLGRAGVPVEWLACAEARLATARDAFAAASHLELAQYAGNKLLVDGDVMSMAHGLELRFPFLDVDLERSVMATAGAEKASRGGGAGKPALTGAVPGFPADLMAAKKRGFTVPIRRWLESDLRARFDEVLSAGTVPDLDPGAVAAVWRGYRRRAPGSEWLRIWALFVLAAWGGSHGNNIH